MYTRDENKPGNINTPARKKPLREPPEAPQRHTIKRHEAQQTTQTGTSGNVYHFQLFEIILASTRKNARNNSFSKHRENPGDMVI